MTSNILGGGGEVASVILVRLEQDDVELGQELQGQGNIG